MLNALTSELSAIFDILARYHVVEHFKLSLAVSPIPHPQALVELLVPLLGAVEECRARLEVLISERPLRQPAPPMHYSQDEPVNSNAVFEHRLERQDWLPQQSVTFIDDFRPENSVKGTNNSDGNSAEPLGHITYSGAPSPECLEALNLSVAASPECLEAMNLSVATSPCYNAVEESASARDSLKTLNYVGTSTVFWDHVALDVGNPADCFSSEPVPVVSNPPDGLHLEFAHDMDSTSVLGDGYMLDISSHVNVSVTDALNASIYFRGLARDAPEMAVLKPDAEMGLQGFHMPSAALDLSHPGPGPEPFLPQQLQPIELLPESTPNLLRPVPEEYSCIVCGKVVRSKASLRRHQEAHSDGHLICDHCGKGFHSAWLLRRHVLAHVSGHVCEMCGTRCVDGRKLRRHMATHSTGTFSCSTCRKCFSRPDGLKRHMDIMHLKHREFACRFCGRTFSVKCNLEAHLDSVHGGEAVHCDVCGKRCKNKASFRAHARTHGAPAVACSICKRSFHRRPQYRRHMKNQHGIVLS